MKVYRPIILDQIDAFSVWIAGANLRVKVCEVPQRCSFSPVGKRHLLCADSKPRCHNTFLGGDNSDAPRDISLPSSPSPLSVGDRN